MQKSALSPGNRRRLVAWGLVVPAIVLISVGAYPYVRYEPRTLGPGLGRPSEFRFFVDRWSGDTETQIGPFRYFKAGEVVEEGTCGANGRFGLHRAAEKPPFSQAVTIYGEDGEPEARAVFGLDGTLHWFQQAGSDELLHEGPEDLIHHMRDGPPDWPWWSRLPYFSGHLGGK